MRRLLLLALCLPCFGQGRHYDGRVDTGASTRVSGTVVSIPKALINVCSYVPQGKCETSTVEVYADAGLTKLRSQPILTDAQGRFGYFLPAGTYMYGVTSKDGSYQGTVSFALGDGAPVATTDGKKDTAVPVDRIPGQTVVPGAPRLPSGASALVEGPEGLTYNNATTIDKDGGLVNRALNFRAAVDGYPRDGCFVPYPFLFKVTSFTSTGNTATLVGDTAYPTFPFYAGQSITVRGLSSTEGQQLNGKQLVTAATATSITFSSGVKAISAITDQGTAGQYIHYPTQLDCAAASVSSAVIATGQSQDLILGPHTYEISQPIILPETSMNATLSLDGVAQVRLYKGPSTLIQVQTGSTPFPSIVSYITVSEGGTGYTGASTAKFSGTCTVNPVAVVSANKGVITRVLVTNPGQCSGPVTTTVTGAGTGVRLNTYMSQPMLYLPGTVGSLPNTLHISGVNFDANSIHRTMYATACWDIYDIGYSYFQHMDCRNTGAGGDHDFAFGNPAELNQTVSQEVVVDDIQDEGTGNNEGEDAKFNVILSGGAVASVGIFSGGSYVHASRFETLFYGTGRGLSTSPCASAPVASVVETYGKISNVSVMSKGTGCLAPVYSASVISGGAGYVASTTKVGFSGAHCLLAPAATPNVRSGVVVSLTFTNHGNCDGNPTITLTDSGGGTGAAATANMALFMQVHQAPTSNYGGRFLASDSTFKDVKIIGNFFDAGMTIEAGSNTIIHAHPQTSGGALYGAIYDAGYNSYFGTECDKVSPYCISFMGPGSMMSGTDLYYGSDPLDGASFAYFNPSPVITATGFYGTAATGIKLLGGTCYNSFVGGTSGWHLAMTSTGPLDTTQGVLPTAGNKFTDIENFNTCDSTNVTTFNVAESPFTSLTIQPFSQTLGATMSASRSGALRMTNGATGAISYRNGAGNSDLVGPYVDSRNVYHIFDSGETQAVTLNAGKVSTAKLASSTVCSATTSPAKCGSAMAGSALLPASSATVVVDTVAVTPLSTILVTFDASLGAALGVTCNTMPQMMSVSARTPGSSFTVKGSSPAKDPVCFSYVIIN